MNAYDRARFQINTRKNHPSNVDHEVHVTHVHEPASGVRRPPAGDGNTTGRGTHAQTDHGTFSLYTVADAQYVSMEMDHGSCVRRPASHPAGRSAAPHTAGHHDKSQMERNSFTGLAARESGLL